MGLAIVICTLSLLQTAKFTSRTTVNATSESLQYDSQLRVDPYLPEYQDRRLTDSEKRSPTVISPRRSLLPKKLRRNGGATW